MHANTAPLPPVSRPAVLNTAAKHNYLSRGSNIRIYPRRNRTQRARLKCFLRTACHLPAWRVNTAVEVAEARQLLVLKRGCSNSSSASASSTAQALSASSKPRRPRPQLRPRAPKPRNNCNKISPFTHRGGLRARRLGGDLLVAPLALGLCPQCLQQQVGMVIFRTRPDRSRLVIVGTEAQANALINLTDLDGNPFCITPDPFLTLALEQFPSPRSLRQSRTPNGPMLLGAATAVNAIPPANSQLISPSNKPLPVLNGESDSSVDKSWRTMSPLSRPIPLFPLFSAGYMSRYSTRPSLPQSCAFVTSKTGYSAYPHATKQCFCWVPSHVGISGNERVDSLGGNKGMTLEARKQRDAEMMRLKQQKAETNKNDDKK
ncbi:hypothetical protein GWK47_002253 [Chionoecetes opilio]|uniref:Uncharacterized protein n=1 Tax=Chionoecetes opilio TaxID=41210 RepID=A0A8J4XU00_CHIOP|nr:hypothetical protein GWK47_002253 [Chionoecetes opilio]